jgi:hypothetical protein
MSTTKNNSELKMNRRNCLAAAGALLAGSALPALAGNDREKAARAGAAKKGDTLYGHGLVWSHELAGVAGDLKLAFDLQVSLEKGTGFGMASDPMHPESNVHFAINSTKQENLRDGETRYSMMGFVTRANSSLTVGLPVRIVAETSGNSTVYAIAIGKMAFGGLGLVVIAIIGVLIGMLQEQPAPR